MPVTRAVPGITAAGPREDDNPYRLTDTLEGGGRAWRTVISLSAGDQANLLVPAPRNGHPRSQAKASDRPLASAARLDRLRVAPSVRLAVDPVGSLAISYFRYCEVQLRPGPVGGDEAVPALA